MTRKELQQKKENYKKRYKVIAWDFNDKQCKESDPHTWEECEKIQDEYMSYDHVGATAIVIAEGEE